jgi:hypothetical protein
MQGYLEVAEMGELRELMAWIEPKWARHRTGSGKRGRAAV